MNDTQKAELLDLADTLKGIAEGMPWEIATPSYPDNWIDPAISSDPKESLNQGWNIRLKPWTLGREINGHVLPDGREWHYGARFTEADLPEGYRPLMVGEIVVEGDEFDEPTGWALCALTGFTLTTTHGAKRRTKRPLPEPDPYAALKAAHAAGKVIQFFLDGKWHDFYAAPAKPTWISPPGDYRIKPAPVPLGPEDVPPNSALRNLRICPNLAWIGVTRVSVKNLTADSADYSYDELMRNGWEIQRPGEDWQPCSKEAP